MNCLSSKKASGGACGENEGRPDLSGPKDQKSSEGVDREAVKRQARRTRNPSHVVKQRPFCKAQTLEEGNMHVCIHEARGPRASTRLLASIKGWRNIDAVLDQVLVDSPRILPGEWEGNARIRSSEVLGEDLT
jgi:hypothetical protein